MEAYILHIEMFLSKGNDHEHRSDEFFHCLRFFAL